MPAPTPPAVPSWFPRAQDVAIATITSATSERHPDGPCEPAHGDPPRRPVGIRPARLSAGERMTAHASAVCARAHVRGAFLVVGPVFTLLVRAIQREALLSDLMTVQVALLLAIAAVLMRPWWLVTHRRCGLCRSHTPRRRARCRFCGAHVVLATPDDPARVRPRVVRRRVAPVAWARRAGTRR